MVWCLMALGVIWLLVRRHWRPALWLGIPTVLIFLLGSTRLAETLVAAEEAQWAPHAPSSVLRPPSSASGLSPRRADAVVALGGGDRISTCDLLGFAVSDGGSRLLTAIELVRTGQASNLVLGGSWPLPANPKLPSMIVLQQWVVSWGLVTNPVTNLGICINTHDEALAYQSLSTNQGWKSLILVTSALHMRRSLALFRKLGLEVTPVAADFQVYGVPQEMPFSPFPRQRPFHLLSLYLHEQIGWWVYRGRGWV
jgi:uncharacterized SAM-binding protein YcdF (DUF218 family)